MTFCNIFSRKTPIFFPAGIPARMRSVPFTASCFISQGSPDRMISSYILMISCVCAAPEVPLTASFTDLSSITSSNVGLPIRFSSLFISARSGHITRSAFAMIAATLIRVKLSYLRYRNASFACPGESFSKNTASRRCLYISENSVPASFLLPASSFSRSSEYG